jgi:hypothetical protein
MWLVGVVAALVPAAATGGVTYGLLRASLMALASGQRDTRSDVREIKEALGLVPVDGQIRPAFPTRDECRLREARSDARLQLAEEKLESHEHRLTVVEARRATSG